MIARSMLVALLATTLMLMGCGASYPARYYHSRFVPIEPCTQCETSVQFVTWDGFEYKLSVASADSQFIYGKGRFRRGTRDSWRDFSGSVLRDDVALVSAREGSFGSTLILGAAAYTALHELVNADQSNSAEVSATFRRTGGGGGSSCPYVYSWNGDAFVLEAEPFGIALGRGLELTTSSVLSSLKAERRTLRLRIANERPETHYVNHIELFSVEMAEGQLALDTDDRPWVVLNKQAPLSAVDHSGADVRELVFEQDSLYWGSDLANITSVSGFADVIDVEFETDVSASDGVLLIRGVNTEFGAYVFDSVLRFLGDDCLQFMHRVEHDPRTIASLKEWIEATSILVLQWNGATWDSIGVMSPEATAVPFTRAFPITAHSGSSEPIRVRLKTLTDIWRLDAVHIDWRAQKATKAHNLLLTSAIGSNGSDYLRRTGKDDDEYAVLLPGQYIDVTFQDDGADPAANQAYVLSAGGYLHRWLPRNNDSAVSPVVFVPGYHRIAAVEFLLKHRELLLPPLYEAWKSIRE